MKGKHQEGDTSRAVGGNKIFEISFGKIIRNWLSCGLRSLRVHGTASTVNLGRARLVRAFSKVYRGVVGGSSSKGKGSTEGTRAQSVASCAHLANLLEFRAR